MIFFYLLFFSVAAKSAPSQDFLSDLELFKARSLVLRSEKAQLEADSTATLSRFLQFTPRLSAGIGKGKDKLDSPVPFTSYDSNYWYWRATADWNLFRGGGDFFSWRSAKSSEMAQHFQVESQALKIELEGARVLFRRLNLLDVQGAQAELLKLKSDAMRIGLDRFHQGKIPLQEVTKMEVDLSQQQNVVRQSEIDLAENEAAYRAFFVDELKTKAWPFANGITLEIMKKGEGSLEQRRLENRARAFSDTWTASRLRHLPSLDLNLNYKDSPLKGPSAQTWSGTLELSLPFWSRYEIASENAQALAAATRAENEAAANLREEELRREFIRKKISLSHLNMEDARVNLERSGRLYSDMLRSFGMGRLSTNDLFLEQDRKIRALLFYTQSQFTYHESLMEACALWGYSAQACLRP